MRSWTRGWWCTLAVAVFMTTTAGAQVVLEDAPERTGATARMLWARGPERVLVDAYDGELATPPALDEVRATQGGRLRWDLVEDRVDHFGMRHVFYRQRYRPAPGSVNLPAGLQGTGVEVQGSLVGLHYDPEGVLKTVGSRVYDDVVAIGGLALETAADAHGMAAWGLRHGPGIDAEDLGLHPSEVATQLLERARLGLYSRGDGHRFDFVWTVDAITADGELVHARVHGETGELLTWWRDVAPWRPPGDPPGGGSSGPSCTPESTGNVIVSGVSQRGVTRSDLLASPSATLAAWSGYAGEGITHQGRSASLSNGLPEIRVYFAPPINESQCGIDGWSKRIRLLPLATVGGVTEYNDFVVEGENLTVPGKAAADAYYNARTALTVLRGGFGWNGFLQSGLGLVLNTYNLQDATSEFARDHMMGTPSFNYAPGFPSVLFHNVPASMQGQRYSIAAALDVVAHEIGHGVIFDRTQYNLAWEYQANQPTSFGTRIHEAFADVIGYSVEWIAQDPPEDGEGDDYELADWMGGEDSFKVFGESDRRVDVDDGLPPGGPLSFHASDPASPEGEPYSTANRLPVSLRLAVDGGRNPVCIRQEAQTNGWAGCESGFEVHGLDHDRRNDVFATYFQLMSEYNYHLTSWQKLSDWVKVAAHDVWRAQESGAWPPTVCNDGLDIQRAVSEAFYAIGYPSESQFVCICQPTCPEPE